MLKYAKRPGASTAWPAEKLTYTAPVYRLL